MGWAAVWNLCRLFKPQPAPSTSTPNVTSRGWDGALTRTLVRNWGRVWKDWVQAAHGMWTVLAGICFLPCSPGVRGGEVEPREYPTWLPGLF